MVAFVERVSADGPRDDRVDACRMQAPRRQEYGKLSYAGA
jgi:hypothetical protein